MVYRLALTLGVVGLLLGLATTGWADLSLGSLARQTAMGGAGIALTDDPSSDAAKNPAALAYGGGFDFRWPNLDFRGRGAASLGNVIDHISQQTNIDVHDLTDLIDDFASGPTTMQLNVATGLRFSAVDVAGNAAGQVNIIPDATLMTWASTHATPFPPAGAVADIRAGAIYALPSVAFAQRVKASGGGQSNVVIGVRVNWLHSASYLDRAVSNGLTWDTTPGVEVQKDSDWSADLGLIYELKEPVGAKVALVATDARKPSLPGLDVETVVHAGFAMTLPLGLLVAADVRNLTGAYGEPTTLHAGGEWKVGPLAFRAGTSSKGSGWSTGIGIKQFNLSFSPKSAFDAATTIFF